MIIKTTAEKEMNNETCKCQMRKADFERLTRDLKEDVVSWADQEFIKFHKGDPLPVNIIINSHEPAKKEDIPESLSTLRERLKDGSYFRGTPCVYFLIYEKEVVYVGQTTSLGSRISSHAQDGKIFSKVFYITVPPEDLLRIETAFIRALKPKLNSNSHLHLTDEHRSILNTFTAIKVTAKEGAYESGNSETKNCS